MTFSGSVLAADAGDPLQQQLDAIARLLSGSSVSEQVLHSGNDAAIQYYQLAKSLYEQAVVAQREGDVEKTRLLIRKSKSALFDAVEFTALHEGGLHQGDKAKDQHDYETIRKSVIALMDALGRVSSQKGQYDLHKELIERVKTEIHDADELYFRGHYKKGTESLSGALKDVKLAIREVRTGDTLVRSLTFSNPEDEYRYELDRNDTHMMLLDMFLHDLPDDSKLDPNMQEQTTVARQHRQNAERLAAQGDYKAAIAELEQSTKKLIDAIRSTGAFIPS